MVLLMGSFLQIDGRVHCIDISFVQLVAQQLHSFAKSLEVDDLTFTQELDDIIHVRVIAEPEDIIICDASLLLWYDHLKTTYT